MKSSSQYPILGNPSFVSTQSTQSTHNQYIRPNVHQWPTHGPTRAACATTIPPLMTGLALQSLPAPNTTMWSMSSTPINTINTSYGFYSPRFSQTLIQPNSHSIHANSCCLASHNQRIHCQQYENNWPNHQNFNNCLLNTHESTNSLDSKHKNIEEITETVSDVNSDDSLIVSNNVSQLNGSQRNGSQQVLNNFKTIKSEEEDLQTKQLKGINEMLKSNLEQTVNKLKETQESLLKTKEKFAIDYIDKYRMNLKKYGDYIKEECTRFYQNDTIAKKLEPIVEQITYASNKAKEEKEKIRDEIAATQTILKEEVNANFEVLPFDYNCLPEFPDLLSFYKSILDEIPLVFLADLNQLKKFANKYIQTKKQSDVDNNQSLPKVSAFTDLNSFPTVSEPFSAPNIADLPKPDFSLFGAQENRFKFLLTSSEDKTSQSAMELSFPKSSPPLPTSLTSFNHLSNSISVEPNASTPKSYVKKLNEKQISPIGQPLQTQSIKESEITSAENKCDRNNKLAIETNAQQIVTNTSESGPKQSFSSQTKAFNQKSLLNSESGSNASKLSQAQSKLLVKLKELYTDLSEDVLINSITETKSSLIACGHPKGFSGMKVSDIITKISQYIDKNVISVNNIPKSRDMRPIRPIQSFKLISSQNDNNISEQITAKVWANKFNGLGIKNDDNNCSICFEPISIITKYETECHHFFHNSCISNWIKTDGSCPICRGLVLPPGEYPQL